MKAPPLCCLVATPDWPVTSLQSFGSPVSINRDLGNGKARLRGVRVRKIADSRAQEGFVLRSKGPRAQPPGRTQMTGPLRSGKQELSHKWHFHQNVSDSPLLMERGRLEA